MQTINNYITERLNPRHLGGFKFPIDGTIKDIIKFLESCEFVQIPHPPGGYFGMKKAFNSNRFRCFTNRPTIDAIWFADTSKGIISYNNYIFSVDDSVDPSRKYYIWTNDNIDNVTREKFLKEINKTFGF